MKPGLPGVGTTKPQSPWLTYFRNQAGGRYRIRTYDFHRVKMALYR
jgi:hypothetical protein